MYDRFRLRRMSSHRFYPVLCGQRMRLYHTTTSRQGDYVVIWQRAGGLCSLCRRVPRCAPLLLGPRPNEWSYKSSQTMFVEKRFSKKMNTHTSIPKIPKPLFAESSERPASKIRNLETYNSGQTKVYSYSKSTCCDLIETSGSHMKVQFNTLGFHCEKQKK